MQSQSPRNEMSRRNMASRRGGLGKTAKLLVLLACAAGLVFFYWGGDKKPAATRTGPGGNIVDATSASPAPADLGLAGMGSDPLVASPGAATPPHDKPADRPAITPKPKPARPVVRPVVADPGVAQAAHDMVNVLPKPHQFSSGVDANTLYNRADALIADGDAVGGRALLSQALFADDIKLSDRDADAIRQRLDEINRELLWSRDVVEGDTITRLYKNEGLFLSQIGVKHRVPYQFLETLNNMDARNLQADQLIKVIQGPLHARVTKHNFTMDLYAMTPNGRPVYLAHFPVGLGKNTPLGNWQVTKASKVTNPSWRDELNGEFFTSDNPENPVGEFWIAIHGIDDTNRSKRGFGIHGTIDPASIGQEKSRGCIRLRDGDISAVFSMLTDHSQGSTVQIVP